MAGRPLKTPNDMKLFRQQYLATLQLQSDINDANLHANQMYVKTGMTPNAPLDVRTTTEMVSDIVRLRTDVMKGLREIADGQNSQAIVSGLNGPQLQFVAQHMPEIIAILKPKYKYGIPAEVFLQSFLIPYMDSEFRRNMARVDLPQNVIDIEGPMPQAYALPHAQAVRLYERIKHADAVGDDVTVSRLGNEFVNLYPSDSLLNQVLELMRTKSGEDDDGRERPSSMAETPEPSPPPPEGDETSDELYALFKQSIKDADIAEAEEIMTDFAKRFPRNGRLKDMQAEINNLRRDEGKPEGKPKGKDEEDITAEANDYYEKLIPGKFVISEIAALYTGENENKLEEFTNMVRSSSSLSTMGLKELKSYLDEVRPLVLPKFSRQAPVGSPEKAKSNLKPIYYQDFGPQTKTIRSYRIEIRNINKYLGEVYQQKYKKDIAPALGYGLTKHKKMVGKGISPSMKWCSFGKHKIDTHKLDDNILAMRTSSGSPVGKYPTQQISKHVSSVIQSMLQNQQPSFDMLTNLTPDEKSFVKRLTKHAGIFGSVGSGLPKNPKDDEDVNEFNIMRGELLAGNDSEVLIKNFKKKILQLMSRDLLPKSQGKDLLMELATLD